MLFSKIGIIDENFDYVPDCYVGTKGANIEYIGTECPEDDYGEIYDGKGKLLMNGLFNAHSHAPMTLLRGYAEAMPLQSWLNDRVFPFEAKMEAEDIYNGCMLAFAEMLRFGTVGTSEMYYFGNAMSRAVIDSGIKSNISLSVLCFDDSDIKSLPIYRETKTTLENIRALNNDRLKLDLSIHAEYTSTPKIVSQMADFAKETGLITQIHLSETKAEQDGCIERHGITPAAYFNKLGVFDSPVVAAHCVWLTDEDVDILADKNVTAASCPVSNLKLSSGICDVRRMLNNGVNVAIGTDGPASNNALNLFSDLKLLSVLSKAAASDPTAVSPKEAIKIATLNGAIAQNRENCGQLKIGGRADLIVLDIDTPWMNPVHSIENSLIYSAQGSDVVLTMVDGRILYRNGEYLTIDIEKIKYNAQNSVENILKRL